jgi:zinc transport system substrate-binding protein
VCKALAGLIPEKAEAFEANMKTLAGDLEALDAGLKALGGESGSPPLVASHPVYNYVARRYGWKLKSMLWEPEEMPADEEWKKLAELLKTHPAKFMVWEGPPAPEIAAKLKKDFGLGSVVFEPCGNRPEEDDYLTVMKRNLENLKPVFSKP